MTNEEVRGILTERQDGVVQIRLQRPDKKNALTGMYAELTAALTEAEHDPTVRVAVLTGSGAVLPVATTSLTSWRRRPPPRTAQCSNSWQRCASSESR